ncbi:MMPL family transporter [Streptomyces sp. NPDC096097]|uniref:MMPL family transporter n=1 Tax=Streptomyces sp. NPDC096097 TaxID=3155546 RepID=UPI00331BC79D
MDVDVFVKMVGFSLAVAVLFDAFVVRMALVPALFALLGRTSAAPALPTEQRREHEAHIPS